MISKWVEAWNLTIRVLLYFLLDLLQKTYEHMLLLRLAVKQDLSSETSSSACSSLTVPFFFVLQPQQGSILYSVFSLFVFLLKSCHFTAHSCPPTHCLCQQPCHGPLKMVGLFSCLVNLLLLLPYLDPCGKQASIALPPFSVQLNLGTERLLQTYSWQYFRSQYWC